LLVVFSTANILLFNTVVNTIRDGGKQVSLSSVGFR
jgi:hypothetical protein